MVVILNCIRTLYPAYLHGTVIIIIKHHSGDAPHLVLPEFELTRWEMLNAHPGWLFKPGERFNGTQLLRGEPGSAP